LLNNQLVRVRDKGTRFLHCDQALLYVPTRGIDVSPRHSFRKNMSLIQTKLIQGLIGVPNCLFWPRLKDFEMACRMLRFFYEVNLPYRAGASNDLTTCYGPQSCPSFVGHAHSKPGKTFQESDRQPLHNGHPRPRCERNIPAQLSGVGRCEIKATRKAGGAVDTHGARDEWMCVFV